MIISFSEDPTKLWLIDFGLAKHITELGGDDYIQTRYYRAPETILGCPKTNAIDMWSIGCTVAELFLGNPLFAAENEYDQLKMMEKLIG